MGVALTVVMAVMYTADVLGRLFLHQQFKGTFEVAQFLLCLIIFLSYPYAQSRRSHIHVGFIVHNLPDKVQYALLAFHFLWSAVICGIVTYALWTQGTFTMGSNRLTQVLEIPYFPIYYASSVLMGLFTLILALDVVRAIMALAGNVDCEASIRKVLS